MAALPSEDEIEGMSSSVEFDRDIAPNGDGRRRIATRGMDPMRETFNLTYSSRTLADGQTLLAALKALQAKTQVQWTPPHESVSRDWTVEKISYVNVGVAAMTVTIVLEEDF
jgi:phage-related protein